MQHIGRKSKMFAESARATGAKVGDFGAKYAKYVQDLVPKKVLTPAEKSEGDIWTGRGLDKEGVAFGVCIC